MFLGVVLNPQARKNRDEAHARAAALTRILGRHGEVRVTRSLDDLGQVVRDLLPRVTHLVSDGGDGALHWLLNEVRAQVEEPADWPTFVPTNGGTIDFVARKVGIRGQSAGLVRELTGAAASSRPPEGVTLDSLLLTGENADGSRFDRIGFAVAAGGVGNRFFDKYYEDPEPRPATIVKVIARSVGGLAVGRAVPRLAERQAYAAHVFRTTHARVTIDGEALPYTEHAGIHAGAFDLNLGGVIRLFPFAREEGRLHFQAGQISPLGMIANLPALATGSPVRGPRLRDTAGLEMTIEAIGEPLAPIVDGEKFRDLSRLTIACGPSVRLARVHA